MNSGSNIDYQFDVIIPVCLGDLETCKYAIPHIKRYLHPKNVIIIGNSDVGGALDEHLEGVTFLDESELLKLSDVKDEIGWLTGKGVGRAGWYYQQFLKMQYAFLCEDEYYLTWDSDTIPVKELKMFEAEHPVFDMKTEYHAPYFMTMQRLINGLTKLEDKSFISEHMLIRASYMREMIEEISLGTGVERSEFWKGVLRAINPCEMPGSGFSEFETFGNWCLLRHPGEYILRDYRSLRDGAKYFDIETITEREQQKISKGYEAISFEKSHQLIENQRKRRIKASFHILLSSFNLGISWLFVKYDRKLRQWARGVLFGRRG